MENKLKPGRYMNVSSLTEFLKSKSNFSDFVEKVKGIETHTAVEEFYSTADLENVIPGDQFRLIECEVVTYLVFN
jgi:hypothetical protein